MVWPRPGYFRAPQQIWLAATWLMTNSIAFLFLLNTNVMWNLVLPSILTHWSMKTIMSMSVTVKMEGWVVGEEEQEQQVWRPPVVLVAWADLQEADWVQLEAGEGSSLGEARSVSTRVKAWKISIISTCVNRCCPKYPEEELVGISPINLQKAELIDSINFWYSTIDPDWGPGNVCWSLEAISANLTWLPGLAMAMFLELLHVHQRGRGQDMGGVFQEGGKV